jgi:exopolysaccharide biosynthesis polyprenyl glycosylphosphotransferase
MRNVLILGSTEYSTALTSRLAMETHLGMRALGHIPMHTPDSHLREEVWLETIDQSIRDGGVQILIIEDSQSANAELLSKLSWHLLRHEVEVLVAPSFIHQFGPRLEVESHGKLPLLYLDEPVLGVLQTTAKRIFDIAFSLFALIALSPILIATTIGILISDFGPIFFIQERVGRNGDTFRILKFRSMVVNAQELQESIWASANDDGTNNKAKDDPRITSIGRFIRKFSIDELPQLINVLKGDMSIVGPRPIQEVELEMLSNLDLRRHLIKPGLTGLWQISGRSDTTWEERIQLDLDYLHNWSLPLDIGIILKTIRVVASGEGAY